ncbi:hypothetical protein QGN32_05530 [Mycolicibacterium sp. ND9-15]|uniref:hypothetical protein n=1 Tax=Mycolicibacterium sp. ND9-15 TaxID=3042320 RepID=UPI002DDAE514|nr:hypothetical protein [Mycolicibacterium sp. ND9-15]WSE57357.1 hypothetical protein QGN32_05530 [Mycolicibacterium sp. ND9-15]
MTDAQQPDWDPGAAAVLADQIAAYDRLRRTCPVAYTTTSTWAAFKHADVVRPADQGPLSRRGFSRLPLRVF